jgi:oligopeptide transport system substrate-binding protein
MSQKTYPDTPSVFDAPLKHLADASKQADQNFSCLSNEMKLSIAREILGQLYKKFPHMVDRGLFKELDRITAILEADFFDQRSPSYLSKLAYSIYFIRKNLQRNTALFPLKDCFDVRLLPSSLQFTFGSKPVLGILAHAYLKDKYEAFDEDHMLFIVRKSISEAQLVRGSIYAFQASKNGIKTLYFEISKKSGLPFSVEEIKRLKVALKREMQFCIEKLVPRIFMTRNEEEVLRSILTLSREIHHVDDLPQGMIIFDQQTSQEAVFTVILVRVCQEGQPSTHECLATLSGDYTYVPERSQIVRYLRKNHPVEASVFKIIIAKDISLLRGDLSLNFYLARQKIGQALIESIGEFRDFNGGIILKQREGLTAFTEAFPDISFQNPDLVENFFYSISPIEAQATLPAASLKVLFGLFLEALNFDVNKSSDYFLKFQCRDEQFFVMIRTPDGNVQESIQRILTSFKLTQIGVITSSVHIQNSQFLGYLILATNTQIREELSEAIDQVLKEWKQKVESQQILRLGLEPTVVSLDPRIGGDQVSSIVLKMLFEGLMRENKEGKIDYGIAKKVDVSFDLKTYFFKLRSTRWSDGSLVTAYDFEYAWKKILSPSFKTPFAYLFYPIKNAKLAKEGEVSGDNVGIKALDELTLKIELEFPTPYFLELTAHTIYSPVNRLTDQLHPNWSFEEREAFVCNGAFQLTMNKRHEGFELIKNPLYWDAENIKLDQAIFVRAQRHQSYEMFQNDHNHWIGAPLCAWDSNFIPQENDEMVNFQSNLVYWYVFNSQKFPFNNKKLRQAFAMAIDRSKLQALFNVTPSVTPMPPLHTQLGVNSLDNLEKAKTLFQEALKEMDICLLKFPIIPLIHSEGPIRNKVAAFVKQQWEDAFGIKCQIDSLEWSVLFSRMTEGDFLVGGMNWQPWVNDPIYTLNAFKNAKDPMNLAKWEDIYYQQILELAERETNLKTRKSYYLQAEEILLEEMPVIPIFNMLTRAIKKKNLKVHYTTSLMDFKWAHFLPSSF